MKRKQALLTAAILTALLAMGLLAVGVNAALNPNSVPVSNSPTAATTSDPAVSGDAQAQINQLKSLIAQYQARDKQYQQQISQDNAQLQQLESILSQLQQAGVIRIQSDGSILVRRGFDDGSSFRPNSFAGGNSSNSSGNSSNNSTNGTLSGGSF